MNKPHIKERGRAIGPMSQGSAHAECYLRVVGINAHTSTLPIRGQPRVTSSSEVGNIQAGAPAGAILEAVDNEVVAGHRLVRFEIASNDAIAYVTGWVDTQHLRVVCK